MPTFLIIGAPRSGTTMLYDELKRHPDVFFSAIKEPSFFAEEESRAIPDGRKRDPVVRDLMSYVSLFSAASPDQATGEASTLYLYSPTAPFRIKQDAPNARLIAILRNPVDRAWSHFLLHRLWSYEDIPDFRQAVEAEDSREKMGLSPHWFYRRVGLYGEQLARYLSVFPPEQMKIFLYEDLETNPKAVIEQILRFLNLDRRFRIRRPARVNVSGYPRSQQLHAFLTQPNAISKGLSPFMDEGARRRIRTQVWDSVLTGLRQWNLQKPALEPEVRRWLIDYYREDIQRTQEILRRDLSQWLKCG